MRLDKQEYIEHITDKDQIMNMRRVLDKIELVQKRHTVQSTDFMNPYERKLAASVLNRFMDIEYDELGGIGEAERKVITIYPDYFQYVDLDIPVEAFMIEGNISNLSHRDFLGGILNLGINRDKIGDILIHEGCVQVVVKKEIFSFILLNLKRVGKERVKLKQISLNDLKIGNIDYKEIQTTVSSLRLDALISSGWHLSRKESQRVVESKKVKVNWEPIDKVSRDIDEGDIISAKGYGRFILHSIEGISKKGRTRVKIRLLK